MMFGAIAQHYVASAGPAKNQANYTAAVLALNPWGHWELDEPSGTTLADSSGSARNMTLDAGTLAQPGPFTDAAAVRFSGTAQRAITTATVGTSAATISCWVKFNAFPAAGLNTAITTAEASYSSGTYDKTLYVTNNGNLAFYVFSGSAQFIATGAGGVALDTWYHLVASVGAAGTKLRINKSTVAANAAVTSSASNAMRRSIHSGTIQGVNGATSVDVSNVTWWNSQLSDSQTDALYDAAA